MRDESFDPGLTHQYGGKLSRSVNKDGSFNVRRRGSRWRDWNLYLWLVNMPWGRFSAIVLGAYFVTNLIFAGIYWWVGIEHLQGADLSTPARAFWTGFFFSTHTLTTVGYGNIAPNSIATNVVASVEALIGLLGFAVATGLLLGRVSLPSARIAFSDNILVSPYQDIMGLKFRIANMRKNNLMELEATVLLMTVDQGPNGPIRDFDILNLERSSVFFFPLTWTVVHPIDKDSPLFGKTAGDLERVQAEILIMIKGFDETFSQTVHARFSYTHDEFVWGANFQPAFAVEADGKFALEIDQVGAFKKSSPSGPATT